VRLGDPDQLALIMATDPYFVTQDNGAGAPLHFATTYKQLDMVRLRCRPPTALLSCFSYNQPPPAMSRQTAAGNQRTGLGSLQDVQT
jgi:hypothetical protein